MRTTRRGFLSIAATTATVASFAPTTDLSIRGWQEPADAVTHSNSRLSWIVTVDGDDRDERKDNLEALTDTVADDYDDTFTIDSRRHDRSGMITLVSPPSDIGARRRDRWADSGLASLGYIDSIEVNREVTLADPIVPDGQSAWSGPSSYHSLFHPLKDMSPSADFVAFDSDMEESTMLDSQTVIDATEDDLFEVPDTSDLLVSVNDTGVSDAAWLEDSEGNTRLHESSTDFTRSGDPSGIGETTDRNGHGDWIAACYAAVTGDADGLDGYLPDAQVLGAKAMDSEGRGTLSDIAASIRHAADEGADIINLSLGSFQYSQSIENALEYAVDQGSIPIAAAGNDRQGTRWVAYPASSEYTIAVGSTTVAEPAEAKSAYYSNVGPHNGITDDSGGKTAGAEIDIAAPGCKLQAATGAYLTGTSMAAPVVGCATGLDLAAGGNDDFEAVRDRLQETAEPIEKAAEEEVGAGMVNARNLIEGIEPEKTQADAMSEEAATRGAVYQNLSGSRLTALANWV